VLVRGDGGLWTADTMNRLQPPKGWHALRHAFCTRLVQQLRRRLLRDPLWA
jgi:hypothetical protein